MSLSSWLCRRERQRAQPERLALVTSWVGVVLHLPGVVYSGVGWGRKMLFGDTRNVVSPYTTTKRRLRGPGKSSLPMFGAQGIVISFKDRTKRKGDAGKQHVGWRWACPYPTPAPCSAEWTWWGRQGSVAQAREWK